jgi:anti-sigma regulatory factor (Ser/Thr protein kinase)
MLVRSEARTLTSLRFAGSPASAPAARRLIRRMLAGCPRLDDCELVASEFIANAIQHSASGGKDGTFVLRVVAGEGRVRIEVEDQGRYGQPGGWHRGVARGVVPAPTDACAAVGGRGLLLVQAIADQTGHDPTDGNGHVAWAELGWCAGLPAVRPYAAARPLHPEPGQQVDGDAGRKVTGLRGAGSGTWVPEETWAEFRPLTSGERVAGESLTQAAPAAPSRPTGACGGRPGDLVAPPTGLQVSRLQPARCPGRPGTPEPRPARRPWSHRPGAYAVDGRHTDFRRASRSLAGVSGRLARCAQLGPERPRPWRWCMR